MFDLELPGKMAASAAQRVVVELGRSLASLGDATVLDQEDGGLIERRGATIGRALLRCEPRGRLTPFRLR